MTLLASTAPARGMRAGAYQPLPISAFAANRRPHTLLTFPQPAALQKSVIVPDVSFYQDDNLTPQGIDFRRMKEHGARGVIIRAGQGSWPDPDFVRNWNAAKAAGLPRGAYWFYDPRVEPKAQADRWALLFGSDLPELDIWGDFEYPASWGGAYGSWTHLYDFMERVKVNLPTVQKTIYTGYYWWFDFVWSRTTAAQLAYFRQYPLNIAWYINDPVYVKLPQPWTAARWWQFTSSGDGLAYGAESLEIDLNGFNGTLVEYESTFKLNQPAPLPPPDQTLTLFGGKATYERKTLSAPRQVTYHVASFDVQGTEIVVSSPNAAGRLDPRTIIDFLNQTGCDIAVNADEPYYFDADEFYLKRRAMARGVKYGGQNDGATVTLDRVNQVTGFSWMGYGPEAWNAVSGSRMLLVGGIRQPLDDSLPPAPRTVWGWDGKKFFWLVIDGRSLTSGGMTLQPILESQSLIQQLGARDAVFLDGGGSSALAIRIDGVPTIMNMPSDGVLRRVGHYIGVKFGGSMATTGQAQEKLGIGSKVRSLPKAGGTELYTVPAYGKVDFVGIVDDLDYPGNALYKWLDLGPNIGSQGNKYTPYLRPSEGERFTILSMPTPDPEPTPTLPDMPVTITLGDDVKYIKQTVNIILKPKV